MYNFIIFFPFFSFLLGGLGGFFFGREGISFFTCFFGFISFFISFFILFEVALCQSTVSIFFWDWLFLGNYYIAFGLFFDSLTCTMLVIITGISACVNFYVVGYMSHDPHITRFLSYLSLFTFFMLLLVSSDNFLQMFIGWEGVGVCSFLLINFWYRRLLANKAALKAMIINRIADILFILGIILILLTFKTTNFVIVFELVYFILLDNVYFFGFCFNKLSLICFFLLIGGIGKSAQIGLHTWLPDAMEGPTPVSALLHAATMVTAGVFLIIRCSPFFEYCPNILFLVAFFGGITAFFFSIIGTFQYDIKKVIAYSTCGQLGFMFFSCGLSQYQIAIFHLFNHAFFKALLFLSAGSVIHALFDEQDMRKMGSLLNFLPLTFFGFFLGSLCIMGFPFLAGFYSKDLLLEFAYSRYILDGSFIYFLGLSSALFTSIYSLRLLIFVFFSSANFYKNFSHIDESNFFMSFSIFLLSIFSIFVGFFFSDAFLGWGTLYWTNSLFLLSTNFLFIDADFMSPLIKNLPLIFSFMGFFTSFIFYYFFYFGFSFFILRDSFFNIFQNVLAFIFINLSPFFYFAGFFNSIYNLFFLLIYKFSYIINTKIFDKGFLELLGPFGFYKFFYIVSNFLKESPAEIIFFYICMLFLALCFIVLFFLLHMHFFILISKNFGLLLLIFYKFFFDIFFTRKEKI